MKFPLFNFWCLRKHLTYRLYTIYISETFRFCIYTNNNCKTILKFNVPTWKPLLCSFQHNFAIKIQTVYFNMRKKASFTQFLAL